MKRVRVVRGASSNNLGRSSTKLSRQTTSTMPRNSVFALLAICAILYTKNTKVTVRDIDIFFHPNHRITITLAEERESIASLTHNCADTRKDEDTHA